MFPGVDMSLSVVGSRGAHCSALNCKHRPEVFCLSTSLGPGLLRLQGHQGAADPTQQDEDHRGTPEKPKKVSLIYYILDLRVRPAQFVWSNIGPGEPDVDLARFDIQNTEANASDCGPHPSGLAQHMD